MEEGKKLLVCGVGTAPAPVIRAIAEARPDYVFFVTSPESNRNIAEIIRQSGCNFAQGQQILSDFEDLVSSVAEIRAGVRDFMKKMDLSLDIPVQTDLTGGTKIMAAALAVVMLEFNSSFSYVGGTLREGLHNTVVNGHEKIKKLENPWEALGRKHLNNMLFAYGENEFCTARKEAGELAERKPFCRNIAFVMEAYELWDRFDLREARKKLNQVINILKNLPYPPARFLERGF